MKARKLGIARAIEGIIVSATAGSCKPGTREGKDSFQSMYESFPSLAA
jgi:hypothetical protein